MRSIRMLSALTAALVGAAAAENFLADDKLVSHVEARVHELQPTRDDRKLDLVGWAPDILAAEKLARAGNRPVFLFTYDGDIGTGRC
jgi:hypothetical protein